MPAAVGKDEQRGVSLKGDGRFEFFGVLHEGTRTASEEGFVGLKFCKLYNYDTLGRLSFALSPRPHASLIQL